MNKWQITDRSSHIWSICADGRLSRKHWSTARTGVNKRDAVNRLSGQSRYRETPRNGMKISGVTRLNFHWNRYVIGRSGTGARIESQRFQPYQDQIVLPFPTFYPTARHESNKCLFHGNPNGYIPSTVVTDDGQANAWLSHVWQSGSRGRRRTRTPSILRLIVRSRRGRRWY